MNEVIKDRIITQYKVYGQKINTVGWEYWNSHETSAKAWAVVDELEPKHSDYTWEVRRVTEKVSWMERPKVWVKGKTYITGPDAGEDQWVCVHVFVTGAAGLVHINPESDVLKRVAHSDRRFYRELSELHVNHKPDPSDYERSVF